MTHIERLELGKFLYQETL